MKKDDDGAALIARLQEHVRQNPFGTDQSGGACRCTCDGERSKDCGAHGFSTLALRKRYGYACALCTMPAERFDPVHHCKHCGRTQGGPG